MSLSSPDEPPSEAVASARSRPPSLVEFEALYRENVDFVWRSLKRFGVPDAALDDATQEVFLVVHRRFHEYHAEGSPRPWLFTIAQRTASGHRRWMRRKGNLSPLEHEPPSAQTSPLDEAMARQVGELVDEFLEQLDPPRRVAFVLTDMEEMTGREVAAATGVNSNTLYYRVVSARKAFVAFLVQHGILSEQEKP